MNNILIFIDWYLPGTNSGGPVRSIANMVEQLPQCNFYIITRNTDYCETEPYQGIVPNKWVRSGENCQVFYFSEDQINRTNIQEEIKKIQPDCIYINGIYSRYFSIIPLQIAKSLAIRTIVSPRGMLSPHALKVKSLKKKLFLRFMNRNKAYQDVLFHATNKEEEMHIQNTIKRYKNCLVLPNFGRKIATVNAKPIQKEKGTVRFISLGRIAEEKGTQDSLAALKSCQGNIVLDLYGTIYSQSYWEKCQRIISELPSTIKVNYRGTLASDEVISTIMEYHFLLLPSKGENFGHSIVESFMAHRPVIISKETPWKDLATKKLGFDVNQKDLPAAIQQAVDMENDTYQKMIEAASKKQQEFADQTKLAEGYERMFN